ncbi:uncharacterized protein MELLADRAFT_110191 [Melampsora larici-populina 98AG31]|uniref:Uncharacterized protein n=1 Tax=Melampsora larici-populina (strain 98AG31 / pathotype 3-4-7) TaxID=747676 RepID=F4RYZ1_MELLP|nr:uncharacterized protein MELLADRAFT_110191 [Melampsora larici-populina 98AG31]EGG02330.1 hypothetical protein MELLADRAFT_110191 [Melampsora larici-populina 98AG31]
MPPQNQIKQVHRVVYHFHESDLKSANPLILHAALTASILDVFGQSSNSITKWILDIQTITIELSTTHGILPTKSPIRQILPEEAATLKKIPSSATTTFRWLELDPVLQYLNCCSSCFAMYPENRAPSHCHHCIANIPGGPSDSVDPNDNTPSLPSEDNEPEFSDSICGEPLFKYIRGVQKPARHLQNDEEKLPPISTVELLKLVAEHSEPLPRVRNSTVLDSERDPEGLDQNLNDIDKKEPCVWRRPDEWALLSKSDSIGYSPVAARAQFYKQVEHTDGLISTFTQNPDNCCIYFKDSKGSDCFARVYSIFSHSRTSVPSGIATDTWLHVQCFPHLPPTHRNPFDLTHPSEVQCALRLWSSTEQKIIKLNEVIAQCVWIMFKPGEMDQNVDVSTIGFIILKH